MKTLKLAAVAAIALAVGGCMRSIEIVKEGENGYTVKYLNLGLKTDVSSISAEKSQGGEIKVKITGLTTDISGESKEIVTSAGSVAAKVAEAVIPAK